MIAFCLSPVGSAAPALAAVIDPKPPQVTVNFIFPPSPLIQHGTARLVYEMVITNYVPPAYTLESIEVDAGPKKFSYSGDVLKQMTRLAGEAPPLAQSRKLEGGRTIIIFFMLDFKHASDIPTTLGHTGASDRRLSDKDVKKAGRVNQASNKIRQPAQEIADDEVTIAKTGSKL